MKLTQWSFISLIGWVMLTVSAGAASRKVAIPAEGLIKLVNPSPANVTYNLLCKDKNSDTVLSLNNQNLGAGKSISHGVNPGEVGLCGVGATLQSVTGMTNGMTICYKTSGEAYTNAGVICGTGYHVCSLPEVKNNRASANIYGYATAPTGTWSYRAWDTSSYVWFDTTGTSSKIPYFDGMAGSESRCATAIGGGGTVVDRCYSYDSIDSMTSQPWIVSTVLCCPDLGNIAHCQVEITSGTSAEGYLSSPQYKGGAPF